MQFESFKIGFRTLQLLERRAHYAGPVEKLVLLKHISNLNAHLEPHKDKYFKENIKELAL